jgi:hypothetical protein
VRFQRTGMALATVTLAIGAVAATTASADAAVPTKITVGKTIKQGKYWKGSGGYSNGSGKYSRVCVELRVKRWPFGLDSLSHKCHATPPGSHGTWSAPPVQCKYWPKDKVYTRVQAFNAYNKVVATKYSNQISAHC